MLAKKLLGKIIRVREGDLWLSARIIETEAYYLSEKGSHASLGLTEKRKALFMPPGTIYMYYARGGDSLNVSARGDGNAVLIKSGYPYLENQDAERTLRRMQQLNPPKNGSGVRSMDRLCAGQTLLCRSLGLKVHDWDQKQFDFSRFYFEDVGECPTQIVQSRRLGIPKGRDEHLMYRYIDYDYVKYCTENPLTKRKFVHGEDFLLQKQKRRSKLRLESWLN